MGDNQPLILKKNFILNKNYVFHATSLKILRLNNNKLKEYFTYCNNYPNHSTFLNKHEIEYIYNELKKEFNKPSINKSSIPHGLTSICLNVTNKCNLNCIYCFENHISDSSFMSIKIAKKSVDFLLKQNPTGSKFSVVFFGGEPLLNFKLIKETIKYCSSISKKTNKEFTYSITTNGTILNTEIIYYFKKYKFNIIVSLDGKKEIHNYYRRYKNNEGTYERIISNINELKKNNINFIARATIGTKYITLVEIAEFFERNNILFDFDFVQYVNTTNITKKETEFTKHQLEELAIQYAKLISFYYNKIRKAEAIYWIGLKNYLSKIHFRIIKNVKCRAGRSYIAIDPIGNIFPCQNFVGYSKYIAGNIYQGINVKNIQKLKPLNIEEYDDCRKCTIRYLCGGGCVAQNYSVNNIREKIPKYYCNIQKIKWKTFIKFYYEKISNTEYIKLLKFPKAV